MCHYCYYSSQIIKVVVEKNVINQRVMPEKVYVFPEKGGRFSGSVQNLTSIHLFGILLFYSEL